MNCLNILSCFKVFDSAQAFQLYRQFKSIFSDSEQLSFYFVCHSDRDKISFLKAVDDCTDSFHFFSDQDFFGVELFEAINVYQSEYESNHDHSFGWFVQQLIKLYAPFRINADVLIFDSDTLPLRYIPSFDNPSALPYYAESNNKYHDLKHYLFGPSVANMHQRTTFIVQHMYFSLTTMTGLASIVANKSKFNEFTNNLPKAFVCGLTSICSRDHRYRLSEYEIYGHFCMYCDNYAISSRYYVNLSRHASIAKNIFGLSGTIKLYEMLSCDLIAFEKWTKPIHIFELFVLFIRKLNSFFSCLRP